MTAPVYRHIDTESTIAGLSAMEFFGLGAVAFGASELLSGGASLLAVVAVYVAFRLVGRGKPAGHLQHWLIHWVRQRQGGRISSAERSSAPQCPFGKYASRERSRRREGAR